MAVLQPGQRLGPYQLGERISRGGMGEVWRATKTGEAGWEKAVALKLILPTLDEDRFAQMFMTEARIAASLDHPNIVPVFGFGREGELLYIEMEQVVGRDLRHLLERAEGQIMQVPLSLFIVGECLKGLAYAHERGVIHRDIKPHNTLCSFEGSVKLTDFGIAKLSAEGGAVSRSEVKGTAGYIAPEVLDGAPASVRSDLFAIGLVLWECLTGKKLFDGGSEAERLRRTFECQVPRLASLGIEVAPGVEELCIRLLAREPSARYGSAAEALHAVIHAPGGRAAGSMEMKQAMHWLFGPEVAAASASASAAASALRTPPPPSSAPVSRAGGAPAVASSAADGVPRPIFHDGAHAPTASGAMPTRTPTVAGEPSAPTPAAPARRGWIYGGVAAAVLVVAGGAVAWRAQAGRGVAPVVAPAVAPPALVQPPSPAVAVEKPGESAATVVIEVVPVDARVFVDGRRLPGGSPYAVADVPRGRDLQVRVERDGFVAYDAPLAVEAAVVRLPVSLAAAPAPAPVDVVEEPAHGHRSHKPKSGATAKPTTVKPSTTATPSTTPTPTSPKTTTKPKPAVDPEGTLLPDESP